jgi:hypothetical protein
MYAGLPPRVSERQKRKRQARLAAAPRALDALQTRAQALQLALALGDAVGQVALVAAQLLEARLGLLDLLLQALDLLLHAALDGGQVQRPPQRPVALLALLLLHRQ